MYTPITSPIFGSIMPIASIDLSLHAFLGVSWMILLPYTVFGGALMVYGQIRLMRGQHAIKLEERVAAINAAS